MGKDLKGNDIGKGFSQRKDGRYEARAMVNGVKINLYNMDLKELKRVFKIEKTKLLVQEKNIRDNVTLGEWYEEWFERIKKPTLKNDVAAKTYDRKIRNTYIGILGNKKIKYISQINIQEATNELSARGYKTRTISEALGVLKSCFEIGVINNVTNSNPCYCIVISADETQEERRVLSKEEQDTFLNEVKDSFYYEAYAILLSTGMRIGEFAGLQWDDVDFVNKEININRSLQSAYIDGKKIEQFTAPKTTNSIRSIPFFGETEKLLRSWKAKQDSFKNNLGSRWRMREELGDLVFTSTMGSPLTRYVLVHDIKRVVENINRKESAIASREGRSPVYMEHVHPHAFRHTFATRCFEKGLDPLFIQKIMGHSNYATTVSYTHVLSDIKNREIKKAGNFLL